jgi:hypothetical protein
VQEALRGQHDHLGAREDETEVPDLQGHEGRAEFGGFMAQTSKKS